MGNGSIAPLILNLGTKEEAGLAQEPVWKFCRRCFDPAANRKADSMLLVLRTVDIHKETSELRQARVTGENSENVCIWKLHYYRHTLDVLSEVKHNNVHLLCYDQQKHNYN